MSMSVLYYGIRVGVLLIAAGFVGWVLHFVYFSVYKTLSTDTRRSSISMRQHSVLCPCIFKKLSAAQWIMGSTLVIVVFILVGLLLNAVGWALYLAICEHCDEDENGLPKVVATVRGVGIICWGISYWLLLVTHFERMRLTFSGTPMQLPQWAPNALYSILSLEVLLFAAWLGTVQKMPAVAAMFLAVHSLVFVTAIVALIAVFYNKTMSVANCSTETERGQLLADTAVRMTLIAAVSLLGTVSVGVLWVVVFGICPNIRIFREISYFILCVDMCLNAFCLMCAFRLAEDYYKWTFGKVHNWFLARVLATTGSEPKEGVRLGLERMPTATSEDKSNITITSASSQN